MCAYIEWLVKLTHFAAGLLRRCYQCRSRSELGSCKDPFTFNATDVENEPGISAIPCASGWCGKVIEGGGAYAVDDYDQAVQRMCVQRGPDDNQDRCANTVYNYKKVYMCFCQGDLCNKASVIGKTILTFLVTISVFLYKYSYSEMI
ncbi:UPAR/Ly6 domain-containing protein rtv isoform X2 [Eurosta solidaginis]|uniref:UPAR/Ly6 domain-containing protein rtv isoform X2 n=1 Tax=Eurosta solidaginis TaxID=178769 RepID=UPI003530CF88